jgi:hypothetical protein
MQVRRPKDIALVRAAIAAADDERVANLGAFGGNKPKGAVDPVVTRVVPGINALETRRAIVAGEYVFVVLPAGSGMSVWDFGVDADRRACPDRSIARPPELGGTWRRMAPPRRSPLPSARCDGIRRRPRSRWISSPPSSRCS